MPVERPASPPAFDALLECAKRGEATAWNELYRWLAPAVAGYLRLQGSHEVEDLTSEVFLGMVRRIKDFEGDVAAFRSWVFVIAHRRLQDEGRRRSANRCEPCSFDDEGGDNGGLPPAAEQDPLAALATERVVALCDSLVPDQRSVLLLRIVADLPIDEVARVLGKSSGAVKSLQHRACATLARKFPLEAVSR